MSGFTSDTYANFTDFFCAVFYCFKVLLFGGNILLIVLGFPFDIFYFILLQYFLANSDNVVFFLTCICIYEFYFCLWYFSSVDVRVSFYLRILFLWVWYFFDTNVAVGIKTNWHCQGFSSFDIYFIQVQSAIHTVYFKGATKL